MVNSNKIKITVLMGGVSSERKISLISGNEVYNSLVRQGYNAEKFDLRKDNIEDLLSLKTDFVFIALHGRLGEDGFVQTVLELKNIPYTGSPPLANALSLNKYLAKLLMLRHNIPTPEFELIKSKNISAKAIEKVGGFPLVVKPVSEGSAIGIGIAWKPKNLNKCIKNAFSHNGDVMLERYIKGREISVPVLGRKILPIIEIIPKGKFYDFKSKYTPAMSKHIIPARISAKAAKKAGEYAINLFDALHCCVFSRIDMIVDESDNVFVLENNTIPGMTPTSLFPDSARKSGIGFDMLIKKIIKLSLKNG